MVTSSTARTTATIAWLSAMLVGHGALAQTDPVPYDCCTDRECLVCPDTAFTLDECGANGHEYGFDINDARGGNFVCEPTGTTPTCCETTAVDPCDPNPGDTCYSFEQFCWETLFGVPCLIDPTSCCTVGGPIPLPFDVMCAADPIWSPPQFCPMRVFAGPPNLQILDATVLEPGVGQLVQLVYDVVLDSDPLEPFTVDVQTTAGGTATELADYLPFISTLSFVPGGPLLQTFQVTVIGDTSVEGDETVEVSISSVQPASAVVVTKGTAIGTILDDDAPATPMFSILDAAPVMEGAGPMEFTITLSSDPPIPVTVDVLGTPVGTADLGLDFNFPVTTLTFLPGGPLSQTVQVTIIDDALLEGDETVVLALGREGPLGLVGVARRTASGIITDNDATNLPPSITFPTPGQSIQIPETDVLFIDVQSTDDNDSEGSGLVYSLLPAPDTHLFIIDATTGVIGFVGGITPPFTNPLDADANGVYELAVTVQDSGGLESVPVLFQVTVVDAGPTDVGPTDPTDVNPTDPTNVGPTGFNGGVQGDPHFLTWNGKMYDYMGACDLVLLHAPNFKDNNTALDIHIRTKTRYDYSYIETAAVQIGEDILEVGSFGEFFLNGVEGAKHHHHLGHVAGFSVDLVVRDEKTKFFEIQVTEKEKIKIRTFKDWVSVNIENADKRRFRGSYGMMGEFGTGRMLGRDGKTVMEEPTQFGDEWQVRDYESVLFQTVSGPQYPESCQLPHAAASSKLRHRLGAAEFSPKDAEAACAHWSTATKDGCIHDVMATRDLDLAKAGSF